MVKKESKPALFIDKDGTLIVNTEYPHGKEFEIIDSTIEIVKEYANKNFYIIMVPNQTGIAKNKFDFAQMQEGFDGIENFYKNLEIKFDDIEYCQFYKNGIIEDYKYDSILRKPNPGMILKAYEKLKID